MSLQSFTKVSQNTQNETVSSELRMLASILKDALVTLKGIARDLNISLDDLTPEQIDQYITECFTNARLRDTSDE